MLWSGDGPNRGGVHAVCKNRIAFALAASLAVLAAAAPNAQAQNADEVRGKCIDQVMKQYPDPDTTYQRLRVQLYINCMQEHGLKP